MTPIEKLKDYRLELGGHVLPLQILSKRAQTSSESRNADYAASAAENVES